MKNNNFKKIRLKISGMHCASCEILIERKFKKITGIEKVEVNHGNGQADIVYSKNINIKELNEAIKENGYSVSLWNENNINKNTTEDYFNIGAIFLLLIAFYYLFKQFNILPNLSVSENMSYGFVFLIGLFAAVSSCIAVVGGLLLAMAGKYSESHPNLTGFQKFKPQIYFNVGRILGYTIFGGLIGALGGIISISSKVNGFLIIIVSLIMLILGFQLLRIFPSLQKFSPKMPKFISHKIHDLSESKAGPFSLGAMTFFLPCGFTQALQIYVLANGNWKVGALTMLVFSLGTAPALISLSAISSFIKGKTQKYFLRAAGVLIVLIAIYNINNGITLAGLNLNFLSGNISQPQSKVEIVDGKQIVKMKVDGYTYSPNKFTVVEGTPVVWEIDGRNAAGCGRVLVMQSLGIQQLLSADENTTITFTPTKTGTIPFNCIMGMMTRNSEFTVVPNMQTN